MGKEVYIERVCATHGLTTYRLYSKRYRCHLCIKEKSIVSFNKRKVEIRNKILDYKPRICSICYFKEIPAAIEYHHIEEEKKLFRISQAYSYSWEQIKLELDKCQTLCAICHRTKHFAHKSFVDKEAHELLCSDCPSYDNKCRQCYLNKQNWYNQRCKRTVVLVMGNNCLICKKTYNQYGYDFHHIDPKSKTYSASDLIASLKYKEIAKELTKCVMLCANCHIGLEAGVYHLPNAYKKYTYDEIYTALCNEFKNKKQKIINLCECGIQIDPKNKTCSNCYVRPTKIDGPNLEILKTMINQYGYSQTGRNLGVSGNAVRKRVNKLSNP